MQIDLDHNGNPKAMLVSFSPANGPSSDGTYHTIFIPIQDILDLAVADRTLVGHPWIDAPPESLVARKEGSFWAVSQEIKCVRIEI